MPSTWIASAAPSGISIPAEAGSPVRSTTWRVVGDAEMFVDVFADRRAEFRQAEIGRVVGAAVFQRIDRRLADVPRRVEVRLADAKGEVIPAIGGHHFLPKLPHRVT